MRDPELLMSSDFENFLLRPGGCCQNRLLYWATQCCFQSLPEAEYRGMRKTNRSYWSISELSEKFGSALIPVSSEKDEAEKYFLTKFPMQRLLVDKHVQILHQFCIPGQDLWGSTSRWWEGQCTHRTHGKMPWRYQLKFCPQFYSHGQQTSLELHKCFRADFSLFFV